MLRKLSFIALLSLSLLLIALPAAAQGGPTHAITFDGFSFTLDAALAANVNIVPYAGDPVDLAQPGGPEPAHTRFLLYNAFPAPESQWDGVGGLRVYRTADIVNYEFSAMQLSQLQDLLARRPDLASYMLSTAMDATNTALPMLPVVPAAQVFRARAQYVDLPGLSGLQYVTAYSQGVSPLLSGEIQVVFQGLSADGQFYVTAMFTLQTPLFPSEVPPDFNYDAFLAGFGDYMRQSVDMLNAAAPGDFTPSLDRLNALIGSMAFTG